MRPEAAIAGSLLFVSTVQAGIHPGRYLHTHNRHGHSRLELRSPQVVNSTLLSAQAQTWNEQAEAACSSQIATLNGVASNPAGMAICYNLPSMDNNTGIFEAELRMYTLSAPTGDWEGVSTSEMMISLAYLGATVQSTDAVTSASKRGEYIPEPDTGKLVMFPERDSVATALPQEIKVFRCLGQLNSNVRGPQMNLKQVQALLIPEVELYATNRVTNEQVQTALSASEASFLMGVFSDADASPTTPEDAASATAAANSVAPFVLPGVRIQIPLIGLGVTMVWVGLFVGSVGWGTIRRVQFRHQYYRRLKRGIGGAVKTI